MFGPRKVADAEARRELGELRMEVERMASRLRLLETEQTTVHDQVRKWMRRAVAAERVAERNQETVRAGTPAPATPAPTRRTLWGARARRLMRTNGHVPEPQPEPEPVGEEGE